MDSGGGRSASGAARSKFGGVFRSRCPDSKMKIEDDDEDEHD
jgi:hypothetical protein